METHDHVLGCGKGLAENSELPATLAELVTALAKNLEAHLASLDPDSASTRRERDAYTTLAQEQRAIAAELEVMARRMASYEDLPAVHHDARAMTAPAVLDAFEDLVRSKRHLSTLLEESAAKDQRMLVQMAANATELR
jgi:hypothetical protein